ncbi:MAG: MBL fold metallo-hydrolase [Candidatus Omnitrophica bacterium]|jgi:glyoxylase-like metal-dependent hydrolase (beta-lactamase superfamily II)|nr:MBL fold metallo-hydrolase [Candidatus Omnitrophota bacterium]
MILEAVSVGPMQVNCYILALAPDEKAVIIDPGDEKRKIEQALKKHNLTPGFIINTHGHIDHIGCDDKFGVPVYIHRDDVPMLGDPKLNLSVLFANDCSIKSEIRALEDKDNIELGQIQLEVIHTPGHTLGGISLLMKKPKDNILFTGDSLFFHSIGRSDLPGGSSELLMKSIKDKLFKLRDDTIVYPGHGPSSTIGEEKKNNPYIN